MESVKKWLSERTVRRNGLYVHYSPPKLLESASSAQLRQWARGGASRKLERAALAGQGRRLLATVPQTSNLPAIIAKCESLHAAVEKGSLMELQELLDSEYNRKKYVACRDEAGAGLLHKAIYYGFMDIAGYLVQNYPDLVHQRDSEGRTPLHYAGACREPAVAAALLERAGAARGARDAAGRTPAGYRGAARTLLALPNVDDMPPDQAKNPPGLVIKRHHIRMWCHDCDMQKLQRVVWEGHGTRLLSEVSNQPVVKKFLEAVPYIMNTIRDIHSSVVENDLEGLMRHSGDPVPPQILSSRDANNMTVTHKAAGLGHGGILGYIAERYPEGINDVDNEGRTPLHYAAAVRDDQHMYNTLVGLGADESAVDNKNRTPGYYINRPQELDKNMLKTLPEAPRTPSSAYPASWDWKLLETEAIVELSKKSRRKNTRASNENISSKNNSNSISENISKSTRRGMKNSSTQELISTLPELDDKRHNGNHDVNKESEVVEENDVEKHDDEEENSQVEDDKSADENTEDIQNETENVEESNNDENEEHAAEHVDEHVEEPNTDDPDKQVEDVPDDEKIEEAENDVKNEDEADNHSTTEKHDDDEGKPDIDVDNENHNENSNPEHETETEDKEHHDESEKHDDNEKEEEDEDKNEHHTPQNGSKTPAHHGAASNEGNKNHGYNEDDDDVQVQGDSHSEYSEIHQRSTAEATDTASAKRGNETGGRNTQESLIEGIISGEAEQDSQDASIQKDESVQGEILVVDSEIDPEVTELINTANMEMLAQLVLNGEGSRLVGRRSRNTELQSFLDNVPTYMQKINKVHIAARDGNIRDLQAALDRRKFAIARDPISPNGATPLHVATVFGKTNIIKYLGGRFPETLSAVDFEGRTALHYAAVLPDNGHYYNLLQQLGGNAKDLDDVGRSAEEYFKEPGLLQYNQLLSDFGIDEETAQGMLTDKGTADSNGHMDIPIFKTDEGRYLAKSLGDPLIKGLTEVANVKPKDPVAFLASFLHNFPDHEKPQLGTQESNMIVTTEPAEVENEQVPPPPSPPPPQRLARSAAKTATRPHRPIDVVTVEPQQEISPDAPEAAFSSASRDEHGQSMLHFAAARTHTRNALFQLLQESDISLSYRDELYRTARDISIQANVLENTAEIDRWVLHLAARGNTDKIMQLLLEGYDHILNIVDDDEVPITDVIAQRGDTDMANLLASIPGFEEQREDLHGAIRRGDLKAVQEAISAEGGRTLARGMNSFCRTALHIAVLSEHEDLVDHLSQACPELLRIGDNLERTPLHYAMGMEKMESLSRILIRAGAKRVLKDLKGRQPSYYFMNKSDILRLKEEEEVY